MNTTSSSITHPAGCQPAPRGPGRSPAACEAAWQRLICGDEALRHLKECGHGQVSLMHGSPRAPVAAPPSGRRVTTASYPQRLVSWLPAGEPIKRRSMPQRGAGDRQGASADARQHAGPRDGGPRLPSSARTAEMHARPFTLLMYRTPVAPLPRGAGESADRERCRALK